MLLVTFGRVCHKHLLCLDLTRLLPRYTDDIKKKEDSDKPKEVGKVEKEKKPKKKKGGFKFKSPPKEANEDEGAQGGGGGKRSDSLSVEQTNELRAKLGLKPLRG